MLPVRLPTEADGIVICGVIPALTPALIEAETTRRAAAVTVVFVRNFRQAETWMEAVSFFRREMRPGPRPRELEMLLLPERPDLSDDSEAETLDRPEKELDRVAALTRLAAFAEERPADRQLLIFTTPRAFFSPTPRRQDLRAREIRLRAGERQSFAALRERLGHELGYDHEAVCEFPGQFAVRGGLLDVYPVNGEGPVRLDFFGDDLEGIRSYDPTTQRSLEPLTEVTIAARSGGKGAELERHIFDYFAGPTTWIFAEPEALADEFPAAFSYPERIASALPTFRDLFAERSADKDRYVALVELETRPELFPEPLPLEVLEVETLEKYRLRPLEDAVGSERVEAEQAARLKFLQQLHHWQKAGESILLVVPTSGEEERLGELIAQEPTLKGFRPAFKRGQLGQGFRLAHPGRFKPLNWADNAGAQGLVVVSDSEILGRFRARPAGLRRRRLPNRTPVDQLLDFSELADGDHLVHLSHGICIYRGLSQMELRGKKEEVISLEFADAVTLHLPLHEAHLLTRYVGLSKVEPKLGKIGSNAWEKTRRAAEQATLDFAAEMLRLQAARVHSGGHGFAPDTHWQREFEAAFPYRETHDQLRAITAAKEDMERPQPMDRLVCGDVGFGKTEVAIRAAFKAVMDSRQVALLVPTTVLAQQHFNTFRERMAGFPVTVEMVSRFRTPQEQKDILRQAAEGKIDILIGTHRLLSKDVRFRDLGLVIIDEEHRFGVRHKERLKQLKMEVDVLAMSATPIPRTLYLALMGARDLSVIETPPQDRLPIRTVVKHYDPELVKKAVSYELDRGGQVFYLHNRVQTIDQVALKLQEMLPEARIGLGHGQMDEEELEQIMTDFVAGRYDILVCTTIIENGLDIPNCNTIIIEGADRFGLSQLYQLRGRVGRFKRQAYAYLLLHRHARMLDLARERLSALRQYNQLGAGFKIAMRDLELRGAGNLLGPQQSGHIAGVGFELYCQLLRQSIARLKGEPEARTILATVNLDFVTVGQGEWMREGPKSPGFHLLREVELEDGRIPIIEAHLPHDYVDETRLRIDFYRRLALAERPDVVKALEAELQDRFGPLPEPAQVLVALARIRTLAQEAGLSSVVTDGNRLKLLRASGQRDDYIKYAGNFPRLGARQPHKRLQEVEVILTNLVGEVRKKEKAALAPRP